MKEMHFVCNLDAAPYTDESIIMYLRKEAVNETHTLRQTTERVPSREYGGGVHQDRNQQETTRAH